MLDGIRYIGPRDTLGAQIRLTQKDIRFTLWGQNLLNDFTPFASAAGQGISRYNGTAAVPPAMYPDRRQLGLTVYVNF